MLPQDWDDLLRAQGGKCAICRIADATVVDHDHDTRRVRGALCRTCNLGIGHLKDSSEIARQAADYLARFSR